MSRQIIKQPNGLYAQWSNVVDDFMMVDCLAKDIIDDLLEEERKRITARVTEIIAQLDRGEKPYLDRSLTWEEAVRESNRKHKKKVTL